jgi:KipI family sensor histidine kinase inhibitor
MTNVAVLRAGDRGWLLELPDNASALRVTSRLRAANDARLVEIVPGHRTVLAVGDVGRDELRALAEAALADELRSVEAKTVEIPVRYDGADLALVAQLTGLAVDEVVARHVAATYVVAFLGFAPGFAYLIGGDPALEVPRRDDPRERVPAGSVAIAGPYSGVYPRESPGGWRLLGRTELTLFDAGRMAPALLSPGDRVRFRPMS